MFGPEKCPGRLGGALFLFEDERHFRHIEGTPWDVAIRNPADSGLHFVLGGFGACVYF